MPKVYITEQERCKNNLVTLIYGAMKAQKKTQGELAKVVGVHQTAISQKLRNKSFKYEDLVEIFDYLGLTDQQIISVMRKGKV